MNLIKKISKHAGAIYAVCFSEKLDLVFTGGADKIIASWNPVTHENTSFSIKTSSAILNLNTIGENFLLVGLFNGMIHVIDLNTKKEVKCIKHHQKGIFTSHYVPSKNLLLIGDGTGQLSIWDSTNYSLLINQKISTEKIRAISSNADNAYIGTADGLVYKIDLTDFTNVDQFRINEKGINSICLMKDKNVMVIGGKDAHLYLFDLVSKKIVHNVPAHNWPIYQVLEYNNLLFSCSRDKTIKQWDSTSMDLMNRYSFPHYKGHTHSINNLTYIPKYKTLVSVGDDKSICFWQ